MIVSPRLECQRSRLARVSMSLEIVEGRVRGDRVVPLRA
jgi:hypothetical protein